MVHSLEVTRQNFGGFLVPDTWAPCQVHVTLLSLLTVTIYGEKIVVPVLN